MRTALTLRRTGPSRAASRCTATAEAALARATWAAAPRRPLAEPLEGRTLFSAGDLDPTFSGDGVASLTPGGGFQVVALDHRGGRTVVLGDAAPFRNSANGPASLVAYNAAGNLDTTFSGDGIRPMPRLVRPTDVFIQPDGKILVAGIVDGVAGVARMLANGGADTSFSGDGFATFPQFTGATGVRVAPNGKVVVSGYLNRPVVPGSPAQSMVAARLNANGTPDTGFSGDGVAVLAIDGSADAVAVQADGKVVLAGNFQRADAEGINEDVGVVRLTTSGGLDATFSGDGKFAYDVAGDDYASAVDLTPDGHVLVGATIGHAIGGALRLTAAGDLDLAVTAGNVGVPTTNITLVRDIRSNFDGTQFYLFVEDVLPFGGTFDPLTTVVRYDSDGTRDYTFGPPGEGAIASRDGGASVGDLTADGKLVTAGNVSTPPDQDHTFDNRTFEVRRLITATNPADRVRLAENIVVEGTTGNDVVRVAYEAATASIAVTLNGQTKRFGFPGVTRIRIDGGLGNDDVRTTGSGIVAEVFGGYGDDYILTDVRDDYVEGGGGNDTINTAAGNDTADGGDGDDLLNGADGNDTLNGGRGKDRVYGFGGNDAVSGAYPGVLDGINDYLDGGAGFDTAKTREPGDAVSGIEAFA